MRDIYYIRNQFLSLGMKMNLHYLNRYLKLILRAPEMDKDRYGEYHHILPSSLFKEFRSRRLCAWNQKRICARTHYLCHWLLWKAIPNDYRMAEAFAFMSISNDLHNRTDRTNSKASANAKLDANRLKSLSMRERFKDRSQHPRTGKKLTDEQIKNLSESHKGHKHSEETRRKMSESRVGLTYEDVTCPHCGKVGKSSGLKSWHFDYCKDNPDRITRSKESL